MDMYKKNFLMLALVVPALVLVGCKDKTKKVDPIVDGQGNGNGNPWGVKLDLDSISKSRYFAAQSFNFKDAEVKQYKVFEGTQMESRMTRFSFFLSEGEILQNENKAQALGQYCEFYIESQTIKKGAKFKITEDQQFTVGTVSKMIHNGNVSFNIVLQADFAHPYQLMCVNVSNVEELKEQVSNILHIVSKNDVPVIEPEPTEPDPDLIQTIKPSKNSLGDQNLGFVYSKQQKLVSLNVGINAKALSKAKTLTRVLMRFCGDGNEACFTPWYVVFNGPKTKFEDDFIISENFNKKEEVNAILSSLKSLRLELSVDRADGDDAIATHVLDLGGFCDSSPELFSNIDSGQMGCSKKGF